jgi:transcription elongation GreA/GreB family factor
MEPESLCKIARGGNASALEEDWMRLLESEQATPLRLAEYDVVLQTLCDGGRQDLAETLAWTAIETIRAEHEDREVAALAGRFLTAIGKSAVLGPQVAELYLDVYSDRDGLAALIEEAGIAGGRPPRRAVRTIEVCLNLAEGDVVAKRHEDGAARIDSIDTGSWMFGITTEEGPESLGAVHLADRYEKAEPNDYRVLKALDPPGLAQLMEDDPAGLLEQICRGRGGSIDSDALQDMFVPDLLTPAQWKKWWTKARAAIKKSRKIKIEGRSPYNLTYVDHPDSHDDQIIEAIGRTRHQPLKRLEVVERYIRECRHENREPSLEILESAYKTLAKQARVHEEKGFADTPLFWMVTRRLGGFAGVEDPGVGMTERLAKTNDFTELIAQIPDESLLVDLCDALVQARPNDWKDVFDYLLPKLPYAACEKAAGLLAQAGYTAQQFGPIIQEIIGEPVDHNEALLWLWDGPGVEAARPDLPGLTILRRMLAALEKCRTLDEIPNPVVRRISQRSRAILSARKYERFARCVDALEGGMAIALYNQIYRLDNLGRAVYEDLLNLIRAKHTVRRETGPAVKPWAREDVLFVTEVGMARKQEEIDHHVNVKMKENARAIGEAASHGDLSENSEYKFALEERDLLRGRLAQMNDEMSRAQIISPDDVTEDRVGIGSKVLFRMVDGDEEYEMVMLSPWEADLERGWFNYKAPLAQKMMGKAVGDTVELDHVPQPGRYEIVRLANALVEEDLHISAPTASGRSS